MAFLILAIATVLFGAVAIYVVVNGGAKKSPKRQPRLQTRPSLPAENPYAAEDKKFDDAILKMMGSEIAYHFYTKLVGITQKNEDGTIREKLIPKCKPFEFVDVAWESDNRNDAKAVAIRKKHGPRLGYLNSGTAEEVATSMKRGKEWRACVKMAKPKKKFWHGCLVICLMQLKDKRWTTGSASSPSDFSAAQSVRGFRGTQMS
jgi:hypothetical protein